MVPHLRDREGGEGLVGRRGVAASRLAPIEVMIIPSNEAERSIGCPLRPFGPHAQPGERPARGGLEGTAKQPCGLLRCPQRRHKEVDHFRRARKVLVRAPATTCEHLRSPGRATASRDSTVSGLHIAQKDVRAEFAARERSIGVHAALDGAVRQVPAQHLAPRSTSVSMSFLASWDSAIVAESAMSHGARTQALGR